MRLLRDDAAAAWLHVERVWVRASLMRAAGVPVALIADALGVPARTAYRRLAEVESSGHIAWGRVHPGEG